MVQRDVYVKLKVMAQFPLKEYFPCISNYRKDGRTEPITNEL